jgi:hypothetical protein
LNLDFVTELTGATINLDSIVEELLESRAVEDTITGGLLEVDEEFLGDGSLGLRVYRGEGISITEMGRG